MVQRYNLIFFPSLWSCRRWQPSTQTSRRDAVSLAHALFLSFSLSLTQFWRWRERNKFSEIHNRKKIRTYVSFVWRRNISLFWKGGGGAGERENIVPACFCVGDSWEWNYSCSSSGSKSLPRNDKFIKRRFSRRAWFPVYTNNLQIKKCISCRAKFLPLFLC